MRKIAGSILCILCMIVLYSLSGCGVHQDAHIPDGYISSEEHWDPVGFQDYTDFCIYQFDSSSAIEADSSYEMVTEADIDMIAGYFSDCKHWMEIEDRLDEFSFDESCISAGDYCFIKSMYRRTYDNYTVYFFDMDTFTLYYIHSNI